MSIFWDRKTYTAFKYTVFTKSSARDKMVGHWYPCPGYDTHPTTQQRRKNLFRGFCDRPQKSWLLYWRTHEAEWAQVSEWTQRNLNNESN